MEAQSIALSCKRLIDAGVQPNEILILLSNTKVLSQIIESALSTQRLSYVPAKADSLIQEAHGRFLFCIIRLICNCNDYIAYRALLRLQPGVGIQTCYEIAENTLRHNLNFFNLFHNPIPQGVFNSRQAHAIEGIRIFISNISNWQPTDTIDNRAEEIRNLLSRWYGENGIELLNSLIERLPGGLYLEELRNYLSADTDEQQAGVLKLAYDRLGLTPPEEGFLPKSIRIMTMHNSKGLSAQIVFIPGLEEEIFPGAWRRPYPGLVLEGARILYVSITRARLACILSYTENRTIYGRYREVPPSTFTTQTGVIFIRRSSGLSDSEVDDIFSDIQNL